MKTVAIYSRKSKFTGKGDSIENQVQMCKDYINRKVDEEVEFIIYEDEGYSGSNLSRPKFKKLMSDLNKDKLDILVCYRLDRISRTVADFSSTLTVLEEHNCAFMSIKEEFDTSSPMGRAMIYIASVFAQLERETIAERIKDNMLELAKSGRWTGGKVPMGFDSKRIHYVDGTGKKREYSILEINDSDMTLVQLLYEKYLELGSLHQLEKYTFSNQIKSKTGIVFEKSTLKIILQNPIYVKSSPEVIEYLQDNSWKVYGETDNIHSLLTYNKTKQVTKNGKQTKINQDISERFAAVSNIKGAIDPSIWLKVQRQFSDNKSKAPRLGKSHNAILVGKLKCGDCENNMVIVHGNTSKKTGLKKYYYTCSLKKRSSKDLCDNSNASAEYVENLVIASLKTLPDSKMDIINNLKISYSNDFLSKKNSIEKKSIEKSLLEKHAQIDNLVTKLSKDIGIEDILLDKIKNLKDECTLLESSLEKLDKISKEKKLSSQELALIESMIDECSRIDTFSKERQKNIINVLIDSIYWYGSKNGKGKIVINFFGSDVNSDIDYDIDDSELQQKTLQFGSPSMTSIK